MKRKHYEEKLIIYVIFLNKLWQHHFKLFCVYSEINFVLYRLGKIMQITKNIKLEKFEYIE